MGNVNYMPVEIWLTNWLITTEKGNFTFKNEVTKKVPLFLLVNDEHFIKRVKGRLPGEKIRDAKIKKKMEIKIEYIKKIGMTNQLIEEEL